MKYQISYFYMIRFMKPNMIPISTALFDPAWYHDFKGNLRYYVDKNGVVNGLRYPSLNPPKDSECSKTCHHDPSKCNFIQNYYDKISKLDFDKMLGKFNLIAEYVKTINNYEGEPTLILLVHEVPGNPCSERSSLIRLFKEHGITLEEFNKDENL